MKKEDFSKRLKEIGALDDVAKIREGLLDLEKEVVVDYEQFDTTSKELETSKSDNESLRQANMKLFLQVGTGKNEPEIEKDKEKPEPLKFEDLFNEKGELK